MSILPTTKSGTRFTILGAVVALAAGGVVAANLASAASASALDYAQCTNGPLGSSLPSGCNAWINGVLNANNSQYREDQVTPQRLMVNYTDSTDGPTAHSVTLKYLDRKAGNHAYDSLSSVNATQGDAATPGVRCQGFTGGLLSTCQSLTSPAPHTATIPDDPTEIAPIGNNVTSDAVKDHQLAGSLMVFGAYFPSDTGGTAGTITGPGMTVPTHDCTVTHTCLTSGDDYATTVITFVTTGTGPHTVQLLFGGHLAVGLPAAEGGSVRGWGDNLGAADVNGGPYHIKWAAADGSSVGNRDNQIMSNAIVKITPLGSTMETTPSTTSATVGDSSLDTVTDHLVMTPASGHAPTGTATFTLYGPLTFPDYNDCTDPDPNNSIDGNVIGTPDSGHGLTQVANSTTEWEATSNETDMSALAPGVYQWEASYQHGTDQYNTDEPGVCGDSSERVTINQATVAGTSSQGVQDTVTITGNVGALGGHVNWYLYSDSGCATLVGSDVFGDGGDDSNNGADGSGVATSAVIVPSDEPTTGSEEYYWKVTYTGDTNNAPGDVETCGTQNVTIENAPAGP